MMGYILRKALLGKMHLCANITEALTQTWVVQPAPHLGAKVKPADPGLQACTAGSCTEFCRPRSNGICVSQHN